MGNNDFDKLGDQIQKLIDEAVDSKNYQALNHKIADLVDSAIDTGNELFRSAVENTAKAGSEAYKKYRYTPPAEFQKNRQIQQPPVLYKKNSSENILGGLLMAGGIPLTAINAIGIAVSTAISQITFANAVFIPLTALGVFMTVSGSRRRKAAARFEKYKRSIQNRTMVGIGELARLTGKPVKFIKNDIEKMIGKGWFLQGHLDEEEGYLLTSNEAYTHYIEAKNEYQIRQKEQAKDAEEAAANEKKLPENVRSIIEKGENYLAGIKESNSRIPGEAISGKISRMELLVRRILDRTIEHPESASDLNKFMDYYLPMTVKLLNAYEEMDRQPYQGENIQKSKKEIEETIDTLNTAFEKLLDSIFEDTVLDVSTDITVLQTLLAQEGLVDDEIQRLRK